MPKVSVIIPVYNGEKYIKESINSVLNQTVKDLEIIIINDASTDNSEKVIFDNFKYLIDKGKIRYYKNDKNKERVFSRNKGFELSTGNFIFFLDYDDIWEKNHIYESLKNFKNVDVIYSFPRTLINSKGSIIRTSRKNLKSLEKLIFSGNIGYPSATAFSRKSFIFYKEEFLFREDWEIFIRAFLLKKKIKIIDNDTVKIREHTNRTSKNRKFLDATLKIYNDYKGKISKNYLPFFTMHVADTAFRFGDFKTGYKMLFSAIRQNPKVLADKRNFLNFLKRGFRLDRAFIS